MRSVDAQVYFLFVHRKRPKILELREIQCGGAESSPATRDSRVRWARVDKRALVHCTAWLPGVSKERRLLSTLLSLCGAEWCSVVRCGNERSSIRAFRAVRLLFRMLLKQIYLHPELSISLPLHLSSRKIAFQVDKRFYSLRSYLAQWENRGLLLRWASALVMMEAYKNIPKESLDIFVGRYDSHTGGARERSSKGPLVVSACHVYDRVGENCLSRNAIGSMTFVDDKVKSDVLAQCLARSMRSISNFVPS